MIKPKYIVPTGKDIVKSGQTIRLRQAKNNCFEAVDCLNGEVELFTYQEAIALLHQPSTSMPFHGFPDSEATARIRSGQLVHPDQLKPQGRENVEFQTALCVAIGALETTGVKISEPSLNGPRNRKFIQKISSTIFKKGPIVINEVRGGKRKSCFPIPKGRTLLKYYTLYCSSGRNPMALAEQNRLKGNRTPRLPLRTEQLISQAIDEVGLDTKDPSVAQVLWRFEQLVDEDNGLRQSRGQSALMMVCHKTVSRRIKAISATARDIARKGEKFVANNRSRGSTDTRALLIGDLVDIDECKISLIASVKACGLWERLSKGDQAMVEEIDHIIQTRLWLVLVFDIATRMPLGWVLTDTPSAEATLQALRMATRDKTREKITYGCDRDPMPAVGICQIRSDNGTGLRNATVKTALLGMNAQSVDLRAYHGVEKPHLERMFGSMESILFQTIHGYTGRKANVLPGYDPIKNGVLDQDEIYGLITRYLVDEYPFQRHYGTGMMGARPIKVAHRINETSGTINPIPDHNRRIALGWKKRAAVTDEGVKVFSLPYTSPELQAIRDKIKKKVTVFSDPDLVDYVTILVEGHKDPILGRLSWTAMNGLTIPEFLAFVAQLRAETPEETIDFDSQQIRAGRKRFEQMRGTGIKHKLVQSNMTQAKAEAMAKIVAAGVHGPRTPTPNTLKPGRIGKPPSGEGVRKVGKGLQPPIENREIPPSSEAQTLRQPNTKGKLS